MQNFPVPSYLTQAAERLRAAGFDATPYARESYVMQGVTVPTQGLSVRLKKDDPRFEWNRSRTVTTHFVAGVHDQVAVVSSPAGFWFNAHDDGTCSISSPLADADQAASWVSLLLEPRGRDNKIMGPMALPASSASAPQKSSASMRP